MYEITFSPERALESLLFLTKRLANPTIHEVLKLRYFADKIHLSRYGFVASGDDYVAMEFGPVASNTYNMMKAARGERNNWIHPTFVELVNGVISVHEGYLLMALRDPNFDLLTPADVECLEEAVRRYGNMSFQERTDFSHDAAWRKAWDTAKDDSLKAGDMPIADIAETVENAAEVLEYMHS